LPGFIIVHVYFSSALGIATVYCFAGFSALIGGTALACGVHSPADASRKLAELKDWGPKARKRVLGGLGVKESEGQLSSEKELRELAHLAPEDQFVRLFEKHGEAEDKKQSGQ